MAEDRFANFATITVVESAANTLTFGEKLTGVGFGTNKGMLIDQIDYFIPNTTQELLVAGADGINFGLTTSSGVDDLEEVTDNRVIHSGQMFMRQLSAVGFLYTYMPLPFQFFPSLIIGTQKIFLAVHGVSLATPCTLRCRLYWRMVDLTDKVIAELVQVQLLSA